MKSPLLIRLSFGRRIVCTFAILFVAAQLLIAQPSPSLFERIFPRTSGCDANLAEKLVYESYGAVFASKEVVPPSKCSYAGSEITTFIAGLQNDQKLANFLSINSKTYSLQKAATLSLNQVAESLRLKMPSILKECIPRRVSASAACVANMNQVISPDWADRNLAHAIKNWNKRIDNRKVNAPVRSRPAFENLKLDETHDMAEQNRRILKVLELEQKFVVGSTASVNGIRPRFFGDGDKPIMYSTAIPHFSQHYFGLAIDIDRKVCVTDGVRAILNHHGWFETVRFDACHFTFLGGLPAIPPNATDVAKERLIKTNLESRGLKRVECSDKHTYWVPNLGSEPRYKTWTCQ